MESHARDLDNYVNVARNRRRRAKALLDFERHDDDELGFRKNDIITVSRCEMFSGSHHFSGILETWKCRGILLGQGKGPKSGEGQRICVVREI